MTSAKIIARYLIYSIQKQYEKWHVNIEEFDITPFYLQKLLYYLQAYSLAFIGKPAFPEAITIRDNLPFVEDVYEEYNGKIVPLEEDSTDFEEIDEALKVIIRTLLCDKLGMSSYALTIAIQRERPWPESLVQKGSERSADKDGKNS